MNRNTRALIGGGLVLALFAGFFYSVLSEGVGAFQYYHTLAEFNQALADGRADLDQGLRLNGSVVPGSIERDLERGRIRFRMTDGTSELPVVLTRLDVSDLFKDDALVVIEGRYGADGVFVADQLLAKCPTKYEAAEPKVEQSAAL